MSADSIIHRVGLRGHPVQKFLCTECRRIGILPLFALAIVSSLAVLGDYSRARSEEFYPLTIPDQMKLEPVPLLPGTVPVPSMVPIPVPINPNQTYDPFHQETNNHSTVAPQFSPSSSSAAPNPLTPQILDSNNTVTLKPPPPVVVVPSPTQQLSPIYPSSTTGFNAPQILPLPSLTQPALPAEVNSNPLYSANSSPQQLLERALPYANASNAVYSMAPLNGEKPADWKTFFPRLSQAAIKIIDDSGFRAGVYLVNKQPVLAFAGTDPGILKGTDAGKKDGMTDLENMLFGTPKGNALYNSALGTNKNYSDYQTIQDQFARNLAAAVKQKYPNVIVTGHSLGGQLAAYAGATNNIPAVTFNPAGVHFASSEKYDPSYVLNFRIQGEFAGASGTSVGKIINFDSSLASSALNRIPGVSAFTLHSVSNFQTIYNNIKTNTEIGYTARIMDPDGSVQLNVGKSSPGQNVPTATTAKTSLPLSAITAQPQTAGAVNSNITAVAPAVGIQPLGHPMTPAEAIDAISKGADPRTIRIQSSSTPIAAGRAKDTTPMTPSTAERELAAIALGKNTAATARPSVPFDDQLRAIMNDPKETPAARQIAAIALGKDPASLGLAPPVKPNVAPPKPNLAVFGVSKQEANTARQTATAPVEKPTKTAIPDAPGKPANVVEPKASPPPTGQEQPRSYIPQQSNRQYYQNPSPRQSGVNCAQLQMQFRQAAQNTGYSIDPNLYSSASMLDRYCGGLR